MARTPTARAETAISHVQAHATDSAAGHARPRGAQAPGVDSPSVHTT
jgi:hypothetical protein